MSIQWVQCLTVIHTTHCWTVRCRKFSIYVTALICFNVNEYVLLWVTKQLLWNRSKTSASKSRDFVSWVEPLTLLLMQICINNTSQNACTLFKIAGQVDATTPMLVRNFAVSAMHADGLAQFGTWVSDITLKTWTYFWWIFWCWRN